MKLSTEFRPVLDRRCQPFLAREEFDGGVTAVLPGGFQTGGSDEVRPIEDLVFSWRVASWRTNEDLLADLAMNTVRAISLKGAMAYVPQYAEWILERGADQLEIVASFLGRKAVSSEGQMYAYHRTEAKIEELVQGIDYYVELQESAVPTRVDTVLTSAIRKLNDNS